MTKKNKAWKWILGITLLAAVAFPAAVSAKPEAKPEAAFSSKPGLILAAKPEAKPEVG